MALGGDQELSIVVRLRDEASKQLNNLKNGVDNLQPTFQKMATVGTAAFVGVAAVAYKSVQAYGEVERSQRQLEHAVLDVSKGTRDQVKAIEDTAAALQKKAGVDADSVKMGAAQLSTFGLQSESVVKLTKNLADFTVNQNGVNASADQYVQSANTIAKALNGQFGILEKTGVRFTEAQQNMILHGTETEKVAALQEGLNQNLRETTDTVAGVDLAMAQMARTQEDIQENIGKALLPAFQQLNEHIAPILDRIAEWTEKNPELSANIILIAGGVAGLVAVLGFLGIALGGIITLVGILASPIVLITALIVALGVAMYVLAKDWQKHWETIKWLADGAAFFVKQKWDALRTWFGNFFAPIVSGFKAGVNMLIGMAEGWANGWVSAANTIINALNKIKVSIPSWVPEIGGKSFGINIPNAAKVSLPRMEHGGIVPGAVGTAVPIIAHGQERVIPAGQAGRYGGGNNFTVIIENPQVRNYDDIRMIKQQVNDALRDVVRNHKLQII